MIYANVELTVEDRKTVANKNIVLYRGDKNVEIRFVIKGNRFTVLDSTCAQMIIKRPSAMSVFSDPAPIQNDTVVFTISEDMIDELKEIGAYTFQVRLYDNSMNARATLPPCEGCLIINQPIATEGEALVNAAMINDSAVLAAVYSDVPEDEIFDNDNAYNRTVWMDGDVITDVRMNKIEDALYYINEKGGGGTATAPYISTSLPETVMVGSGEDFELDLDFSSPNLGKGTLKVFINDVDSMNQKIDQGMSITTIPGSLFSKGTNMVVIYVLDRVGMMSNSLTFYIRYGGTEVTSTFDAYTSYDYGATVRYYFTPTALDTSLQLTFYMEIDGVTQAGVPCISDVRSYYTFPTNLSVGNHYCRAWVTDGTTRSNVLAFNLIILDATSLVVATDTLNPTVEEGTQLVLDYKVYMKNNTSFITKTYVDNILINTGTCTLETAYYRTTSLTAGTHTIKVEVFDVTETYSDFVTWTVTVTESTYTMLEPATAGSTFMATAYNKSNVDENREVWIGTNQDNDDITASLSNFSFNSENGWIDDALVISGNSWVEIPIQPLANNARYGFTLDIEFKTKAIGVEDAEVLTLWNETDNCGIKITTEQLIMRSKTGNQCDLYFAEDEIVSAIFVIDRDEKTAKIYLNGVMCEAFALSDYEAAGQKFLEDFTVNSNVYLGGYNKNGYCAIKNVRIYEVALATNEILNNFMSNVKDKAAQRELVEFQKGNTLPTLTIYCDFAGLGKDDKKPCNIVYNSPDVNLYGESFTLDGKYSQLQYQGTSSMQYPIKNYRINPRNADGKVKLDPFNNGVGESRFTLKADFMSSGHWQNTGLAKWVNDKLYNYNVNDESSMNARKWYDLQNGGSLKGTRESINGFPCRLILVNDGETALNEGQQEPTPGNTKDMGIFNFNNDKDNVETLGFDTDIFPNCMSFEVTANSDTSAGAFVPFEALPTIDIALIGTTYVTMYVPLNLFSSGNFVKTDGTITEAMRYLSDNYDVYGYPAPLQPQDDGYIKLSHNDSGTHIRIKFRKDNPPTYIECKDGSKYALNIIPTEEYPNNVIKEPYIDTTGELEYLQNSFELRYPDADDVGGDYGYLGMEVEEYTIKRKRGSDQLYLFNIDFLGTRTIKVDNEIGATGQFIIGRKLEDGTSPTPTFHKFGTTVTLDDNVKAVQVYGLGSTFNTILINDVRYYIVDVDEQVKIEDPVLTPVLSQDYGLKRVIDWVGNCTDEQFVAEFDQYFHRDYTLRYYLLVITLGMVDNLGKNMMFDTFDGKIWLPRFYDMDTICSYDNSGEIKFDVDIEMEQGYWNTSSSRLWTKIRDLMHDELVEKYNNMRQNGMSYESFMSYFYDKQIAQIPQTYYNKDYDVKYAPYADEYMGKAHGDGYEHLKRWLKRRLIFTDTLFDYAPSYTNDALTIRANTLDLMSLEIETYTPVYQHVSFYNGNMEKIKIDGKTSTVFNGTAQTATDQEVLIYGGSNIKSIKGIQSMNPNSMLIGNATRLTELDLSDCPILTVVNSNKANFSPHTYLNKLDISNCPQLGGTLNISNSPLLQEVNALGSAVDNILLPTSVRNLETLRVPKTVTSLTLNDAGLLYTLEMEEGNNLQSISLTNCNNLTETINFDLTQVPTVLLDNSYNGEELYMSDTTNLTLKNMPSLKRVIFTPNSEYSAFDINNVLNGANYKITTFNNPMMTDFITTAPHRYSYNNSDVEYEEISKSSAKKLESVYFDSTAYVDLGFKPTSSMKIELDVKMEFTEQYAHWIGSNDTNKIQWGGSATSALNPSAWSITPTSNLTTRQIYTISCTTGGNANLYLFSGYYNGNVETNYCGKGTLYSCKIYDNDALIHDYIPCVKNGIACLYDLIEEEFIYAIGTLIGGEEVGGVIGGEEVVELLDGTYTMGGYWSSSAGSWNNDRLINFHYVINTVKGVTTYHIKTSTSITSSQYVRCTTFDEDGNFVSNKLIQGSGVVIDQDVTFDESVAKVYFVCDEAYMSSCTYTILPEDVVTETIIRKKYGDITPNTAFTANTLDLADTQFQNVKFLCTTDVYNLKVPTSMKNFYCDSAMDIDTDVIEDASYEVVHEELIEPYTTNYEKSVWYSSTLNVTDCSFIRGSHITDTGTTVSNGQTTDYMEIVGGTTVTWRQTNGSIYGRIYWTFWDVNKTFIKGGNQYGSWQGGAPLDIKAPEEAKYVKFGVNNEWDSSSPDATQILRVTTHQPVTPNIIPSSANGSLIFNMYSNNTTQPTSTSPYMWDLTGLKLEDFYTYGMNNNVKPSDDSYVRINTTQLYGAIGRYNGDPFRQIDTSAWTAMSISPILFAEDIVRIKITTSSNTAMLHYYSRDYDRSTGTVTTHGFSGGGTSSGDWLGNTSYPIGAGEFAIRLLTFTNYEQVEWFDITTEDVNGVESTTRFYMKDIPIVTKDELSKKLIIEEFTFYNRLDEVKSITMPQRMPGYSVRLVNADITPDEYPTMLYPKLIDTTLPITGKLDYTKYNGTSLAWAYAYTTGDVTIDPVDSRNIGQITHDYNKLYGTDFVDVVDVWVYKDTDTSKLSTNEAITKAYIELTSSNYKTRVDEVLAYYPNCTDLYFFDDGSVTTLYEMLRTTQGTVRATQIKKVAFMDGYFQNLKDLSRAFINCRALEEVSNIPDGVIYMNYTFEWALGLKAVPPLPSGLKELYHAFERCAFTTPPVIPNTVYELQSAFAECHNLQTPPNIPSGVTDLTQTFYNCSKLTTAPAIPSGVTNMSKTFNGCTSLTQAPTIPQGVTNMRDTFSGCKALTQAPIIPQGVTDMQGTFYNCSSLTQAPAIPNGVTNIQSTFYQCTSLTQAPPNIPNSVTNMANTFYGCSSLTTAPNIPNGVTNMTACFYNCTLLTTAPTIPEGVTIMHTTYYGCTALTDAGTIPSTVNNLEGTFRGCTSLVNPPQVLTNAASIGGMYRGCGNLVSANIPLDSYSYGYQYQEVIYEANKLTTINWLGTLGSSVDIVNTMLRLGYNAIINLGPIIKDLVNNHLREVTEQTLIIGETYLAYLTEDEIAQATAKGWTLQ